MMNVNLYTKELKRSRKNWLIWTCIVVGFTIMVMSIFPSMQEMGKQMEGLMQSMPPEIMKAFGMDAQTWQNILGFYSTYFGIYIVVLLGIYTGSAGATILTKEEKDQTAEFLMTRPLSRKEIYTTKMVALLTLTFASILIQTLAAITCLLIFDMGEFEWSSFFIMQAHGASLVLLFTCIGVVFSIFMKPKMNFMGPVVGIVFGTYLLDALSKATETTEWLGYITPFHYADFSALDPGFSFNPFNVAALVILSVLCLFVTARKFYRKDILG